MAETLIAVIIVLALGHALPALAARLRRYGWFLGWARRVGRLGGGGAVLLALLPLLPVALLQWKLSAQWLHLPTVVLGVLVLFWSWGPRDLDVDVQAVIDARDPDARLQAAGNLWPPGQQPTLDSGMLLGRVFAGARNRWFAVLLWFLLLGPSGALLYRLTWLLARAQPDDGWPATAASAAQRLLSWLRWPVSQLMTLSLALVADFDTVLAAWRQHGGRGMDTDAEFLIPAGRASVRSEVADEAETLVEDGVAQPEALVRELGELPELRQALSLCWRMLILWLAVLAVFVIAAQFAIFVQAD